MLFNSHIFLFAFLPITLLVFVGLLRSPLRSLGLAWLVLASLVYYGWWNPRFLALLGLSMACNYALGLLLTRPREQAKGRRWVLAAGIVFNLGLLAYFKYASFLVDSANALLGTELHLEAVILPLAISFFTFQQIAFLVDVHRGLTREFRFVDYCLFVSFFPQLIAGPIVHHREMLPQFARRLGRGVEPEDLAVGTSLFAAGLFKKVVLADSVAGIADPVFATAAQGGAITTSVAWAGVLAYTLQIYFDFSGYSDMALGIGRLFGIRLPVNFSSPYRATSIVDFWRRWHMTLSRFLRDYLYIPLGGNRRGPWRRYRNLMLTMLLGGLWHGAGWTFVVWGGLHGLYLILNQGWRSLRRGARATVASRLCGRATTFVAVVFAWVFFRAESFDAARRLLWAMVGRVEVAARGSQGMAEVQWLGADGVWILGLLLWVWCLPNSQQVFLAAAEADDARGGSPTPPALGPWHWQPNLRWAALTAAALLLSTLHLSRHSELIYFQF